MRIDTHSSPTIRRALISVSDKTALLELAHCLHQQKIEIIATAGTASYLQQHAIPCLEVASYTGSPEMMQGRVKTLHPKIHAGILARRGQDDQELANHDIPGIDLVVINLYPFSATIAKADCQLLQAIEQIDIGGPCMLRSAAKNYHHVITIMEPQDYPALISLLEKQQPSTLAFRERLAHKVFYNLASYNAAVANYLASQQTTLTATKHPAAATTNTASSSCVKLPAAPGNTAQTTLQQRCQLRYGENPQQQAAWHCITPSPTGSLSAAELIQGKALSYNNLLDANAALQCVREFSPDIPCCAIIKHATICGLAIADQLTSAYSKALRTDPVSAFGGIIALNQCLDLACCELILSKQFAEVIIVPALSNAARALLASKTNLRVLVTKSSPPGERSQSKTTAATHYTSIDGGLLVQQADHLSWPPAKLKLVTGKEPTEKQWKDIEFAWRAVSQVKSNAMVFAADGATLGIGSGQTSRVFSTQIAILKAQQAGLDLSGSTLAADAFLPFADSLELAAAVGTLHLIQPGGSKRDPEVIAAAKKAGITLIHTGERHFKH